MTYKPGGGGEGRKQPWDTSSPTLITGDARVVMGTTIKSNSIDLIVTSPPYNCKIKYDCWDDELQYDVYLKFMHEWLVSAYNVLKDDGRIAINLFYEISQPGRGGRVFVVSDVWQIMKEIGFEFHGIVRLGEDQSERIKYTAWGSWKSPSAPYIYNPEECVLIACKKIWKKQKKGASTIGRDEFMESVKGVWKYRATTSTKTEASFSIELPLRAINILSYEGETVLDPFSGRGTTGSACKILNRNYIGIDISAKYNDIARDEIGRMASKYDIDKMFDYIKSRGVFVSDEKNVRKYIIEHTTLIKSVCSAVNSIHGVFEKEDIELDLNIYTDHYTGCGSNLQIDVRTFGDYDEVYGKCVAIREADDNTHDERGGYLMITTDFQPPKYKKQNPEIKNL